MRVSRIPNAKMENPAEKPDLSGIDYLIKKYRGKKGSIIPLLQGAQEMYGFIPREVFERYNAELGLSLSEMYGVATFYAQFRLAPVGKHIIKVCHGTACHVQNAGAITDALKEALKVKDGETTEDRMFTLESVACLGCCSLAPVMMIGNDTFGKLTGSEAVKVIKEISLKESN